MKNVLYISIFLLSLTSCKSIEKMVDKGHYDEAIVFAAKKLHGEKDPKTKYVQGLEEAFAKVTQNDVDDISQMMGSGRADDWDRIYNRYLKMEKRQRLISPFLPLISKDGYKAEFRFLDVADLKTKAADKASAYNYEMAERYLQSNDKDDARRALVRLNNIDRYYTIYKDKEKLKDRARYKGTTRVAVEVINNASAYLPFAVERQLKNLNLAQLNSRWVEYYYEADTDVDIDVRAILDITGIYVSPGSTNSNRYTEEKEINDGFTFERDRRGGFVLDTLGQKIKVEKFKIVSADVRETWLSKDARITGFLVYYDNLSGRKVKSLPVEALASFDEYGCEYNGDKRALSQETKRKLKPIHNVYLPSSEELLVDAGEVMKQEVLNMMRNEIY